MTNTQLLQRLKEQSEKLDKELEQIKNDISDLEDEVLQEGAIEKLEHLIKLSYRNSVMHLTDATYRQLLFNINFKQVESQLAGDYQTLHFYQHNGYSIDLMDKDGHRNIFIRKPAK